MKARTAGLGLFVTLIVGVVGACSSSDQTPDATTPDSSSLPDTSVPLPDAARAEGGAEAGAEAGPDATPDATPDVGVDSGRVVPGAPSGVAARAVAIGATVATLAGSGDSGFANGTGAAARFNGPHGLAVDPAGNVFVADSTNNRIRRVTAAGVVTTLAGSGAPGSANGTGAAASFSDPFGVALDSAGNVYVADHFGHRIRKVTPAGVVTTVAGSGTAEFADGTGAAVGFNHPESLVVNAAGDILIVDTDNNRIRKMTPAGVVTTLAGSAASAFADGTGAAASFFFPFGIGLDSQGNAYIGDEGNHRIRKMTPAGVVTTLAGSGAEGFADGTRNGAIFNYPSGVAVDASGNVYVADYLNGRIRRVTAAGVVTTLAGTGDADYLDGPAATARFNFPVSVATDASGTVYVADLGNQRIRKITSVGIGKLEVTWSVPGASGSSPITGYQASASAAGQPTKTCTTTGATTCTVVGLTSGAAYSVSVTATNAAGTSAPSAASTATPN